jgi:putative membrane protein insertion efficiency factor
MKAFKYIWNLPRKIATSAVNIYQKTLSPDHSRLMKPLFPHGHCKYTPTCSEYAKLALQKNGFIIGALKSIWRVLRCNPWSKGGIDLP